MLRFDSSVDYRTWNKTPEEVHARIQDHFDHIKEYQREQYKHPVPVYHIVPRVFLQIEYLRNNAEAVEMR